ncbi:MAG TPA: D-tyrosyl-tRNA(Tyr) deacylase [Candidatus Merdisoma merdipullorum]|nr:D-tyrosyl-tRNA(Tyr) deacylase [Candidatus Merdisoma merdipullorum]
MKFVIQRVSRASVTVRGKVIGRIGQGYLVLVGVGQGDTKEDADRLMRKMIGLRIFSDENGKINKSLKDVGGELLLVSQFTLYADCRHGNRPGFTEAGDPQAAKELYEYVIESCRKDVPVVEQGEFGAEMQVELINDGPFTIILDSEIYRERKK